MVHGPDLDHLTRLLAILQANGVRHYQTKELTLQLDLIRQETPHGDRKHDDPLIQLLDGRPLPKNAEHWASGLVPKFEELPGVPPDEGVSS
jgi:hypothetical protein